mgnify:CR=1 FL=1
MRLDELIRYGHGYALGFNITDMRDFELQLAAAEISVLPPVSGSFILWRTKYS